MPELPEVETIVRDLRPQLVGRAIEGVAFSWTGAIAGLPPEEFAARVVRRPIQEVVRRGKYILMPLAGGEALVAHLRMTGRLVLVPGAADEIPFQRVVLHLDDSQDLRFADMRKFGRLRLLPASDLAALDAGLGPEPLAPEFTTHDFRTRLRGRRGRVKALLLDQAFIAGIGNIYADEALFAAAIHPNRAAASLTDMESERLFEALRSVLLTSIGDRGTSFRDYLDGRGLPGGHQDQLLVYRRTGDPCRRCGTPIARIPFGGRGTHYCPRCQPPGVDAEQS